MHNRLLVAITDVLSPQLRPKYRAAIEKRTYLNDENESLLVGIADVAVFAGRSDTALTAAANLPARHTYDRTLNSDAEGLHITIERAFGKGMRMQHFSITEIQNTDSEVLNQAAVEPVLLTTESQPSYVIMSVQNYEQLINRLAQWEDLMIGQQAQAALSASQMIGTETFTAEIKRLAALDGDG